MRRNENRVENPQTSPSPTVSEYQIGHTRYIVELHFCTDSSNTLEDIVKRLIARYVGHSETAA